MISSLSIRRGIKLFFFEIDLGEERSKFWDPVRNLGPQDLKIIRQKEKEVIFSW